MLKRIIISTVAAALVATPALALAAPTASERTASQAASPEVIVTSARDIVGREIRDPHGKTAGEIRSLVVDLRRGYVLYALVGSEGELRIGDDNVAVPFSALHLSSDDDQMHTSLSVDRIVAAPRISEDQLADLAKPSRITTIYAFYALPLPPPYLELPSGERPSQPEHFIFIRRHGTRTVAPAGQLISTIHGETVKGANGEDLGEIERLMIDVDAGRVAYVLIGHGGFLGLGREWTPVPPQALSWSDAENAYVVHGTTALPHVTSQDLRAGDLPAEVRRDQLLVLYQRYGIAPYWSRA